MGTHHSTLTLKIMPFANHKNDKKLSKKSTDFQGTFRPIFFTINIIPLAH